MAITESKKQSDLEKRLKLLRQQVYGREDRQSSAISFQTKQKKSNDRRLTTDSYSVSSDITYLYQDLSKIGILTSLAIGIQIALFILTKNHILNLNLF